MNRGKGYNNNMKRRKTEGYVVIEFAHAGIPDDQLRPEEFNDHQIAVMNALDSKFQDQIRRGIPMSVIDIETGEDIEIYNRRNVVLSEAQKDSLARVLFHNIQEFYKNPENVKKMKHWEKENGL